MTGGFNLAAIKREHAAYLVQQKRVFGSALEDIATEAIAYARATTRVKRRSGAMSRGWGRTPAKHTALNLIVRFYNTELHAFFQEDGTGLWGPKRDYIYPKRARFLRWVSHDGVVHFARRVKGVPPKYIGKHSLFAAYQSDGPRIIARQLGRIASRF